MKNQAPTPGHGVPESFINKFGQNITAILSGFDRLRFRGTLRLLFQPQAMEVYLNCCHVLIKHFSHFAQQLTDKIKAQAYEAARQAGRPVQYLSRSDISKEDLARQMARRDGIGAGLIAVFSAVEPCLSYSVRGDRQSRQIHLIGTPQVHSPLPLLPASGLWLVSCTGADLVSFYGGCLSQWARVVGPADGSGGSVLRTARQLFCAGEANRAPRRCWINNCAPTGQEHSMACWHRLIRCTSKWAVHSNSATTGAPARPSMPPI